VQLEIQLAELIEWTQKYTILYIAVYGNGWMEKDGHIIFIMPEFGLGHVKITAIHSFIIVSSKDYSGNSGQMYENMPTSFPQRSRFLRAKDKVKRLSSNCFAMYFL
jgi:hypothetical protein